MTALLQRWMAYCVLAAATVFLSGCVINEIYYDAPEGQEAVELLNIASGDLRIGGWWVCHNVRIGSQFSNRYVQLPADTFLPGSGVLVIRWNSEKSDAPGQVVFDPAASEVYIPKGEGGELGLCDIPPGESDYSCGFGLYIAKPGESIDFNDPGKVADFVQWGGQGSTGETPAVQRGIWPPGGFISPITAAGRSLHLGNVKSSNSPAGYFEGPQTIGSLNGQPMLDWIQQNIFTQRGNQGCAKAFCHDSFSAGDLNLSSVSTSLSQLVNVPSTACSPLARVSPGDPNNSCLVRKLEGIVGTFTGSRMPLDAPSFQPFLSNQEINAIRGWIAAGAPPP